MSRRWWAVKGDVVWMEDPWTCRLEWGSRDLWQFVLTGPSVQQSIRVDLNLGSVEELPSSIVGSTRESLVRELKRTVPKAWSDRIEPAVEYVLNSIASAVSTNQPLSQRAARLGLSRLMDLEPSQSDALFKYLSPRYLEVGTSHLYPTAIGLAKSDKASEVASVVARFLEATLQQYAANPDSDRVTYSDVFGSASSKPPPYFATQVLRVHALVRDAGGSADDPYWVIADDIEDLYYKDVRSLGALWNLAQDTYSTIRPWPEAAIRRDGSYEQIELQSEPTPYLAASTPLALSMERPRIVALSTPEVGARLGPDTLPTATPVPDENNAAVIGNWKLGLRIGQGGYGKVYEAWHTLTGVEAVVKTIYLSDPGSRVRFGREAASLGQLTHPSLPRVYDAGLFDHESSAYIAIERLRGCDLKALVDSNYRFSEDEVILVAVAVSNVLALAHDLGIIHRDIKPSNLFLDATTRQVCVLDFGCAKLVGVSGLTTATTPVGTLAYQPPEAFSQPVSPSADAWSLGVTCLELATGANPFITDDIARTINAITNGQVPQLDARAYPRVSALVASCLVRDPEQRLQDGASLVAFLGQ